MEQTQLLQLPYIMPSQAQKHVTHNEAIRTLDALVFLTVSSRRLSEPPALPSEGNRLIVADGGGDFTGHDGEIAAFLDGGWLFFPPQAGWLCWCVDEAELLVFLDSGWTVTGARAGGSQNLPAVGINTGADASNRLAVASEASLFTHEGEGHQLKLNKATAADTGSVLFQTGWAGRAEMGLAGNDDFSLKVSPDGATWTSALTAAASDGAVRMDKLAIGADSSVSELRVASTRTTGLDPHVVFECGKSSGQSSSVVYQRADASQQMLFSFKTAGAVGADGHFGTLGNQSEAIYILAGSGSSTKAAFGFDDGSGLRIGTVGNIDSGTVGARISKDGDASFTRSVAVGTGNAAHPSAILDLDSTAGGLLPPRMTTAERDAISRAGPRPDDLQSDGQCASVLGWLRMGEDGLIFEQPPTSIRSNRRRALISQEKRSAV